MACITDSALINLDDETIFIAEVVFRVLLIAFIRFFISLKVDTLFNYELRITNYESYD